MFAPRTRYWAIADSHMHSPDLHPEENLTVPGWRRNPPRGKRPAEAQPTLLFSEQDTTPADIALIDSLKNAVKPIKESLQRAVALFARAKQQRGQGRAERKRVESGEYHRDGDGDCELLIQPAGDPRNEGGGHEHSGEN